MPSHNHHSMRQLSPEQNMAMELAVKLKREGISMREQHAEVSGWMGKGLAYITLLATAFIVFAVYANSRIIPQPDIVMNGTIIVVGCVSAAVVFLIGQALRYILAGNK